MKFLPTTSRPLLFSDHHRCYRSALSSLVLITLGACSGEEPESSPSTGGASGNSGGTASATDPHAGGAEATNPAAGGSIQDPSISGGSPGNDAGGAGGNPAGGTSAGGTGGVGGETGAGGETATGGALGVGGAPSACLPQGKSRNPLVSHIFTADPNAVVYGERIYLYVSHDIDGQEDYDMVDYRAFSSDDMVNWQDHGVLIHANELAWATNLYAPGACEKNGKYYLYIPNGGSSIGVAVADDPGGPFVDPLGTALVTKNTPGVSDVDWLFDPACFVDDDGQGYLYFGGGPEDTGDNGRVIRLGEDMISLKDTTATTIAIPAFFEAAHVHKRDETYYLQYSSDFSAGHSAALEYMTSSDPMTGFEHQGTILPNSNINDGNNNHGSIVEFMGKSYLFYHARKLQQELGVNKINNRSVAVQEITFASDGTINPTTMSTDDFTVEQIKCMDGFAEIQAERLAAESGIEVEGRAGETIRVTEIENGDWIGYSQVDFRQGATALRLRLASATGGGTIDVRIDGCDDFTAEAGTSLGTCEVTSAADASDPLDLTCTITETSGPHDLCLSFSGDPAFEIDSFRLE